ncbi:MAG: Ig domain-containing protein [Bacteroidales bacterium]|nr:Ig domain-containing protein [Bacteroidales bacterium]
MKKIFCILSMLLTLFACKVVEPAFPGQEDDEDGPQGRVTIQFAVDAPIATLEAKALSEKPTDIENLYVAVFGSSGYLKEYVQAEPIQQAQENGVPYTYSVSLALSENSRRIVHFIANGPNPADVPFDQVTSIIPNMLSTAGKGCYWQTVTLPGIKAKRNSDGLFVDKYGRVITNTNEQQYVVSDETQAALDNIRLIRNFSKIEVLDTAATANFTLYSFTAVNTPTAGSLAPYYSGGFVEDYQTLSYAALRDSLHYPGRLPLTATFNTTIPTESDFLNKTNGVKGKDDYVYLYERPAPNDQQSPTFVIMYGHYTDPEDHTMDGDYYYKVDLMEDGEYYPLYRNFKYKIDIRRILKPGADTPEDAANSVGSGDVSGAAETQNLTDISDGQSRIQVDRMSETLIHQYTGNDSLILKYKFYPDITRYDNPGDKEPRHDNSLFSGSSGVTITKENGTVITNFDVDAADDPTDGFRRIRIQTTEPTSATQSEYLTISGTVDGRTLYRKVRLSLLSKQTLYVDCQYHHVLGLAGQAQNVDISLPTNLPESMFPLVFQIESDALSLTPNNAVADNNLPVEAGATIKPGASGTSFYYLKTLSYNKYTNLPTSTHDGYVVFTTYFLTNKPENAATVYVANKFFNTGQDSFSNYEIKHFLNGKFDGGVQYASDKLVTLKFHIETRAEEGNVLPDRVYLTMVGLRPANNSGLVQENGRYYFEPSTSVNGNGDMLCDAAGNVTIYLRTTVDDGAVSVALSAAEYENASVVNTPITSISLNKTSTTIGIVNGVAGSETLTASYQPNNATQPTIEWSSSDTTVAKVNQSGVVTAVAKGTATITATVGPYSASCAVTVHKYGKIIYTTTSSTISGTGSQTLSNQTPVSVTLNVRNRNNQNYVELNRNTTNISVSAGGKTLTEIVLRLNNNAAGNVSCVGTYTNNGGSNNNYSGTWTGQSTQISFTQNNSTTRLQLKSIEVTYLDE